MAEQPGYRTKINKLASILRTVAGAFASIVARPEYQRLQGKRVESFTIITTEPNELVRPVQNRMPVILRPEDEEQWLDAARTPFAKAKSVLKPYPDELMDAQDVSPIVNSAKYDGPECIQPVSDGEIPRGAVVAVATTTKLYHFYLYPLSTVVDTVENDARDCIKQASYDKSPQLPLL